MADMRTFVIGDIHGSYKALVQCLKVSQFHKARDRLICLGDVCDRGRQVKECIDELLSIPHCVYILGNHDAWALNWAVHGAQPPEWLDQGGAETIVSYRPKGMSKEHIEFLSGARTWFFDRNRLFVHGGFDPHKPIEETSQETLLWDRKLLEKAQKMQYIEPDYKFGSYDEVYVGHTPTLTLGRTKPQKFCNVWAMDTGAGWGAQLTIMDIDTKQFWQSNPFPF